MGKIIKRTVSNVNWPIKALFLLTLTLFASVFMCEGLYKPRIALAAITTVSGNSWSRIYTNTNAYPGTVAYTVGAGSGSRMLVVAITANGDTAAAKTCSVTYGAQPMSAVTSDGGTTQSHTYLFYLNEAGLAAASNSNLVFTWGGTPTASVVNVFASVLDGVDQTANPITSSVSGVGTTSVTLPSNLTIGTGDYAVEVVNMARLTTATYRTITAPAANWASVLGPLSSNDVTVYNASYILTDTTAGTTTASHTISSATASIYAMSAMSIKPLVAVAPTVTTPTAASITNTTATLGATVTADGGAALSARGTVWGTSAAPTGNQATASGTTVDAFTHSRTGLTAGTKIYYRGYATNSAGTGYSSDGSFYTEPNTQATLGAFTGLTTTGMTINWTRGTGDAVIVLVKQGSAVDSNAVDGTYSTYNASTTFGSGTQLGTGNYVVHKGTGTSVSIAGLSPSNTYHVSVTEYSGAVDDSGDNLGTNYKASPVTGSQATLAENSTTVGTATAVLTSSTSIDISMPYTGDADANSSYSYRYRTPSGSGAWSGSTAVGHSASPATATITGLTAGSSYDVEMTYIDVNGVTGTNPQTVSNIVLPSNATSAGAMSFPSITSSAIAVQVAFTGDGNTSNSCVIKYGTVNGTYPNTITAIRNAGNYTATATGLNPLTNYYFQATFSDGDTVTGTNPVTASTVTLADYSQNDLLHNSDTINKFGTPTNYVTPYGTAGKWGIPTGQYGAFSCATCHTNVKGATTNIKRVVAAVPAGLPTIGGRTIKFQNITGTKAGNNGFGDDTNTYTTSEKICNVCHTATTAHRFNNTGISDPQHQGAGSKDCTACHPHNKGFYAFGDCMNCHSVPQGKRRAIIPQFTDAGNSHHYQGNDFSTKVCYPCHWAANVDGSLNAANHGGYKKRGTRIKLVVYTSATRPAKISAATMVEYSSSILTGAARTTAQITQLGYLNNHCLGCHGNGRVKNTDVFGDGKTPMAYKLSTTDPTIAQRYGTTAGTATGTATWGKVTVANNVLSKTQTKAYNAHNATGTNQRAWTTAADTFSTPANSKTRYTVYCFDCHNSHGSSSAASSITTSYSSATGRYRGGILKETVANQGGYSVTYKPVAGGSAANHNVYNAGAALCFNCHMNNNTALESTPWSYNTFGSYSTIIGYWDTKYFGKSGERFNQVRDYSYKGSGNVRTANMGGHFGKSDTPSTMTTTPTNPINNLCTPCHDPHGVSPTMTNAAYAVPLLRGTWVTSPYKQDVAPSATNEPRGGSEKSGKQAVKNVGSTPAYNIDQNTMQATNTALRPSTAKSWTFATNASTVLQPTNDVQFAGLCIGCHAKTALNNTAPVTTTNWKTMSRIHNSVKGWAVTTGTGGNLSNKVHAFTCSKCHTVHNSRLPRLLVTNCLDVKHRGRVASTGSMVNVQTGSNSDGSGAGRFPQGGGGVTQGKNNIAGERPANPGPWFFGKTNGTNITNNTITTVSQTQCHQTTTAGGAPPANAGTTPSGSAQQLWNNISPW